MADAEVLDCDGRMSGSISMVCKDASRPESAIAWAMMIAVNQRRCVGGRSREERQKTARKRGLATIGDPIVVVGLNH